MMIEPVHCGSSSILKVRFFGTPCIHFHHWPRQCPMHPSSEHYFNSSQASEKQIKYVKKLFFIWFLKIAKNLIFFIIKDIGSEGDNMSIKALKLLLFFGHRNVFTFKIVKKSLSSNIQTWSLDVKASFALELFCSPTMSKKILLKMQLTHFKRFNIWIFLKLIQLWRLSRASIIVIMSVRHTSSQNLPIEVCKKLYPSPPD